MKHIFNLLLLIALPVSAFAQASVYHLFPVSNAGWIMEDGSQWCLNHASSPAPIEKIFSIRTDTLINGKTWHIVDGAEHNYCGGWDHKPSYACIREDSSKHVFVCCQVISDTVSHLLYNFNMKKGDTLPTSYTKSASERAVVYATDSILLGNTYVRQYLLHVTSGTHTETDSIAEEVGNWQGLFSPITSHPKYSVACFHHNSDVLSHSSYICDFGDNSIPQQKALPVLHLFPNPAQNTVSISTNLSEGGYELMIYNALGAIVRHHVVLVQNSLIMEDISALPVGMYYFKLPYENKDALNGSVLMIAR